MSVYNYDALSLMNIVLLKTENNKWPIMKLNIISILFSLILFSNVSEALEKAPGFALMNSRGDMILRSKLEGHIIISFYASYCLPCRNELPELIKLSDKYSSIKLILISADINDQNGLAKDKAGQFLKELSINRDYLLDYNHIAIIKYSPQKTVPSVFLVNAEGYIVFSEIGYRKDTLIRLEKAITKLK